MARSKLSCGKKYPRVKRQTTVWQHLSCLKGPSWLLGWPLDWWWGLAGRRPFSNKHCNPFSVRNNSVFKTVSFKTPYFIFVHFGASPHSRGFVDVTPAVGLILQLLCSQIGNWNFQKKTKQNIVNEGTPRHTLYSSALIHLWDMNIWGVGCSQHLTRGPNR